MKALVHIDPCHGPSPTAYRELYDMSVEEVSEVHAALELLYGLGVLRSYIFSVEEGDRGDSS